MADETPPHPPRPSAPFSFDPVDLDMDLESVSSVSSRSTVSARSHRSQSSKSSSTARSGSKRSRRHISRADVPLETPNPAWSFPFYLDVGLYWYTEGNRCLRHVPGEPNPFFDPAAPTVIYVHGWQKDAVVRGFRETFDWAANSPAYGLPGNTAQPWLDAGWNVGMWYWSQYADEPALKLAEAKIWSADAFDGLRWRHLVLDNTSARSPLRKAILEPPDPDTPPLAALFCNHYVSLFPQPDDPPAPGTTAAQPPIRLVGHSLGAQLIIAATYELLHRDLPPHVPPPSRLALIDLVFTSGKKSFLKGRSVGSTLSRQLDSLAAAGIALEAYRVSKVPELASSRSSDRHKAIQQKTAFVSRKSYPADIPKQAISDRHAAGPWLYFTDMASSEPLTEVIERKRSLLTSRKRHQPLGPWIPLPQRSDTEIREMMQAMFAWKQASSTSYLRIART